MQLAVDIRDAVRRCTKIPVTIGLAATKTLAKMANRHAKRTKRELGVYHAGDKRSIDDMLRSTEIGDVWGIGSQHELMLRARGFVTAADFTKVPEAWVRKEMTVMGLRTQMELKGQPCIKWEEDVPNRKGICSSKSFGHLVTCRRELQQALATYTSSVAKKLRSEKSCARQLHVFLQTNVHRKQDDQYLHSVTLNLRVASNNTGELMKYAMTALNLLFKPGYNYHKTGVIARDLVRDEQVQLGLFDNRNRANEKKVMAALDDVNKTFGDDTVRSGVQEFNKKWKLRANFLSQRYTTRFDELPILKAV